jgi:hypothetical protein
MKYFFTLFIFLYHFSNSYAQSSVPPTFDPPEKPAEWQATEINETLQINGKLDELAWQKAQVIKGMVQQNPNQGEAASHDTETRILFNQKFLYVSMVCYDKLKRKTSVRVQNMARDCDFEQNDIAGFAIDGFLDKRNSVTFQSTPFGAQRDIQVIDSDNFNREWDALWFVRTSISDTAWVAEFAIPWKTLRYPNNCEKVGITLLRNIRKNNEYTVLPSIPRQFSPYRMAYEAILVGIKPPPPTANIQVNPYFLYDVERRVVGNQENTNILPKLGGEVKWAVSPNTILDLTLNTDFAQADADRQVVNLSRFSVLFPERRQFFLEGANIFNATIDDFIQPFFSRRIGLDANGNKIPLDAGLRMTNRTGKHTIGALAMRQRATDTSPLTHYGVFRYSKNFSAQSRLGGMFTYRNDGEIQINGDKIAANNNYTATMDGLFRPSQKLTISGMVSGVRDTRLGDGLAAQGFVGYQTNLFFLGLLEFFVRNYNPGIGLERFGVDYVMTAPVIDFDIRPKWLPKFIRSYGPDASVFAFHNPNTGRLILAETSFSFFDVDFQTGGNIEVRFNPNWQVLSESFTPLPNAEIPAGRYFYMPVSFSYNTDLSKKVGGSAEFNTGKYYDGNLNNWNLSTRFAPIPHIELTIDYEFNRFKSLGINDLNFDTHLLGINTRLALNPRFQLIGFYQRNTSQNRDVWNVRLSWEYRPLSYIFLVFNSNQINSLVPSERLLQQQGIGKITFLKQF